MSASATQDELRQLIGELEASDAYRIVQRFEILDTSYYIFYRSSEGLLRLLEGPSEQNMIEAARIAGDYSGQVLVRREFLRRLHNYCASAMMLVEHLRKLVLREWYPNTVIAAELSDRIRADFASDGLHNFVKGLRNYVLHFRMFPSVLFVNWMWSQNQLRIDFVFTLRREALLQWDGWNQAARTYIMRREEEFAVNDHVVEYTGKVRQLQEWLYERLSQEHRAELAYVAATEAKIKRLHEAIFGDSSPSLTP